MDPQYAQRYRDLYLRHWWWRGRERVVLRELRRLAPPHGWSRILDVGCGDGLLFRELRRFAGEVEGIEPDATLVTDGGVAGGRVHVRPFDTSFRPGHRYGLILFLDVLEHITDAEAAVDHAVELLEPGGTMLVTGPAFLHLWTTHDDLNRHVTRYDSGRLRDLLGRGMTVERCRYFYRWMYPAKLLVRAVEAVRRPEPRTPRVPPAYINRALRAISVAEEVLLRDVPMPFGSSLLAVARKH